MRTVAAVRVGKLAMSDSTVRISAAQVTRILQRAAELDARSDTLSLDELRHIAAEAGIAPAATDAAIRELMTKPESASDALPTPAADAAPSVAAVARPSPSPLRVVVGGRWGWPHCASSQAARWGWQWDSSQLCPQSLASPSVHERRSMRLVLGVERVAAVRIARDVAG